MNDLAATITVVGVPCTRETLDRSLRLIRKGQTTGKVAEALAKICACSPEDLKKFLN